MNEVVDVHTGEIVAYLQPASELTTADRILSYLGEINNALHNTYDIADVMEIRDRVDAIRFLTNKMDLDQSVKNRATESQIRTQRRLVELVDQQPKQRPGEYQRSHHATVTPSYADMGLDKREISRIRPLAQIPEDDLNAFIQDINEKEYDLTIGRAITFAREVVSGNSKSDYDGNEWYTPTEYVDLARKLMGEIDVDPATCEWAQARIKATTYYTKESNGMAHEWHGRVWLNPPYSYPDVEQFTSELRRQYENGITKEAVLLVNNCTDAGWFQELLRRYPVCFSDGRVKFERPGASKFATRQGQAFFYLGQNIAGFRDVFSNVGTVLWTVRQ
jgi:phage N-6-adenine-methyltransferase